MADYNNKQVCQHCGCTPHKPSPTCCSADGSQCFWANRKCDCCSACAKAGKPFKRETGLKMEARRSGARMGRKPPTNASAMPRKTEKSL